MILGIASENVRILCVRSNKVRRAVDDEEHIQGALRQALYVSEKILIGKMRGNIWI